MIYTSNYATAWKKRNTVAISRSQPKSWSGTKYMALMPTWAMIKIGNWEKFKVVYRKEILDKLDADMVADSMQDKIMLCYEDISYGAHCHRELVREWLNENGHECQEYEKETKPTRKKRTKKAEKSDSQRKLI